MNIIMITGASSGLGMEFALQLDKKIQNIDEIWLIARREERLEQVSDQLLHDTRIFPIDVTDTSDLASLTEELNETQACIKMLINCAGYGILGDFAEVSLEEQTGMLAVNCMALTKVTHLCIPYMKRGSRIIQIASSAAFLPQQGFAVYAATKSYVLSFARAIGMELRKKGIYVTAVCPGPVNTEFFDIAEKYQGRLSVKNLTIVEAKDVVADAITASLHKRSLAVYGPYMKAVLLCSKLLPHSLILTVMDIVGKVSKGEKG